MCCIESVIQDYFGGDLIRYAIEEDGFRETHYANRLDNGTIIDTTASQYVKPVTLRIRPVTLNGFSSVREKRLADTSTHTRYELLKKRVHHLLQEA